MDIDWDLILWILAIAIFMFIVFYAMTYRSKDDKEYERKLEESLENELLEYPETGTKMTLEQAESGTWIEHDNEFRTTPKEEINKIFDKGERKAEKTLNYLRKSKFYKKTTLNDYQFDIISKTRILTKYKDWSYSNPFKFDGGLLLLPAPEIKAQSRYEDDYSESQLMFWVKIIDIGGHYYLREKINTEKLFDLIRNDDDLSLTNYECFTIEPSSNILKINHLLKKFENQKGLEIELHNDNLFIKTLKQFRKKDIIRIQEVIDKII